MCLNVKGCFLGGSIIRPLPVTERRHFPGSWSSESAWQTGNITLTWHTHTQFKTLPFGQKSLYQVEKAGQWSVLKSEVSPSASACWASQPSTQHQILQREREEEMEMWGRTSRFKLRHVDVCAAVQLSVLGRARVRLLYLRQTGRAYEKCTVSLTPASHRASNVCQKKKKKKMKIRPFFHVSASNKVLSRKTESQIGSTDRNNFSDGLFKVRTTFISNTVRWLVNIIHPCCSLYPQLHENDIWSGLLFFPPISHLTVEIHSPWWCYSCHVIQKWSQRLNPPFQTTPRHPW